MKIIIATGGTGGHIYPATALADRLMADNSANDILFIGNSNKMEATEIPKLGYKFIGIEAAKFNDQPNKLQSLAILYKAFKRCLKLVKEFNPDVVLGFGGYVSVPVLMAAAKLHIPTLIHEQNSVVGLANKTLGHIVDKVVTVYKSVDDSFPKKKVSNLGNPRESAILDFKANPEIFAQFGLDCSKKTILIVMGSLGSESVNEKMVSVLDKLKDRDFNVLYVTGRNNYDLFASKVSETATLKIVPYIDQFNIAGNCRLVVSRGGATSACEYMALGLPSIIIPSPYVPNNHQFINAKAMLENGASLLLEEKDLNADTLVSMIDSLIYDDEKLAYMSGKAKEMSHPHAADDIIKLVKSLVGE